MRAFVALVRRRLRSVRVRSALAATLVVAFSLIAAGGALLALLHTSLESSARSAASARAALVVEQVAAESPGRVDGSLLATDGQIGLVQIVDATGAVVAGSPGADRGPLIADTVPMATIEDLGRIDGAAGDFWVTAGGAATVDGPVTVIVGADRDPVEDVVATVAALLAVVGPIVVALVAVVAYRLVGGALSPVESIRSRVDSITNDELSQRISVPGSGDEIARLAVTMNTMLGRLEDGQRVQRRFVSDASHELRSPLSTITTALELAASTPDLLDDALIADSLLPEARRMRRLIEDLLILARSDERRLGRADTDVDVDDVLYAERLRSESFSDLTVRANIEPVRVLGDPDALARTVRNLVDNALRHAHSTVVMSCAASGDDAVVVVEDDGPGIAEADRARVFDRFVRLDEARTRARGGAGLGLAIVADTVSAHGGTVTVGRSTLGGARFEVRIPARQPR
ncbi:MAG: ATP-binding protein [Rhodococcus sp. (in: high G+C Gram-positive bacteria)]